MLQIWSSITVQALLNLWEGFLRFMPALIAAIIVFVVGWSISILIGKVVTEILRKLRFNQIFEKGNWDEALARASIKVDASGFVGAIVKWVLVIVFLQASVGILGWLGFVSTLGKVVAYLPNVIVAALIFVVTVIIADIVEKVIRTAVERTKIGYGRLTSTIIKWAIWIFAIVIILDQLNIGGILPQGIIFGIIGFLALAGGLAFGLGGKDAAAEFIKELKQKVSEK